MKISTTLVLALGLAEFVAVMFSLPWNFFWATILTTIDAAVMGLLWIWGDDDRRQTVRFCFFLSLFMFALGFGLHWGFDVMQKNSIAF